MINMVATTIKAMVKKDGSAASKEFNRKLYNCGWDMFTGFLAYKAKMESRIYRKVPKDFPSTQQCCRCSKPNKYMKPYSGRIFACVKCRLLINRDLNAAINICVKGITHYLGSYKGPWGNKGVRIIF